MLLLLLFGLSSVLIFVCLFGVELWGFFVLFSAAQPCPCLLRGCSRGRPSAEGVEGCRHACHGQGLSSAPSAPLAAFSRSEKRRSSSPSRARGLLPGAARGHTQPRCRFSDSAVPTQHRLWGDTRRTAAAYGLLQRRAEFSRSKENKTNCMYEIGLWEKYQAFFSPA